MRIRGSAVLLLAGLSATAQQFSLEKEASLGKQLAQEFRRRNTAIDNPGVQRYVDGLGQKLAAQMPEATFPFTFALVVDDSCGKTEEPAALPGGYVFVSSGLFLAAENESEFAGMLTHAMEHIAQRHAVRQATKPAVNGASIPLIFAGPCSEGLALPANVIASQHRAEIEADALAVQAMASAGYDPNALARYLERVEAGSAERVAGILAAIEKLSAAGHPAPPQDQFAAARQQVRLLVEKPVRAKAPPSLIRK